MPITITIVADTATEALLELSGLLNQTAPAQDWSPPAHAERAPEINLELEPEPIPEPKPEPKKVERTVTKKAAAKPKPERAADPIPEPEPEPIPEPEPEPEPIPEPVVEAVTIDAIREAILALGDLMGTVEARHFVRGLTGVNKLGDIPEGDYPSVYASILKQSVKVGG